MRELEKTFTWIVKLRSSRETESSQAKTGRRMQAKERAWEKARKCKVTTKARTGSSSGQLQQQSREEPGQAASKSLLEPI